MKMYIPTFLESIKTREIRCFMPLFEVVQNGVQSCSKICSKTFEVNVLPMLRIGETPEVLITPTFASAKKRLLEIQNAKN